MASTATIERVTSFSEELPILREAPPSVIHEVSVGSVHQEEARDARSGIELRRDARANAASAKEEERQALLAEHKALVLKKYSDELTQSEVRRLRFVGWHLDRIEDARNGHVMDALEKAIERYERIGADIERLVNQLNSYKESGRHR